MRMLAYDTDEKTVIGWSENGVFTPVVPAPEGDALDVLVDDVASTIEERFGKFWDKDTQRLSDRLDGLLRPHDGTHSRLLIEGVHQWESQNPYTRGVRSWIVDGTLRSLDDLTPVLNAFVAARQFERRMHPDRVAKDWKLTDYDLGTLGASFGLPAPPTHEQLRADFEAREQEREERRKRNAETDARIARERADAEAAFKASPEGQRIERVESIVEKIVGPEKFALNSKRLALGISKEQQEQDARWVRAQEITTIRPVIDDLTKRTTYAPATLVRRWKEGEEDYRQLVEMLSEETIMDLAPVEQFAYREILDSYNDVSTWEPWTTYGEPRRELQAGEVRLTFKTHADLVTHMRAHPEHWWDVPKATVWMDDDRSFVLDYAVTETPEITTELNHIEESL